MENASKALIIAGAILLSILLISLGIMIFNQAQSTVNNSGMSQAEVESFNNKFLKYEGKQKGSVVRSMINEIIANNAVSENDVNVNGSAPTSTSGIELNSTYTVELEYSGGRVSNVKYSK